MKRNILNKLNIFKRNLIETSRQPELYIVFFSNKIKIIVTAYIIFILCGELSNAIWKFPYYQMFALCFTAIFLTSVYALKQISQNLNTVISTLANQENAKKANRVFIAHCQKNIINIIIPIGIVAIFSIGGCLMFGNIKLTPTFIWFMIYFVVTVYISIIIYLQYVYLAIYIFNLSKSTGCYMHMEKFATGFIPAQTEWLQKLTKTSHTARAAFFTIGGLFIFAFGCFCFLPNTAANITSICFYILWGIIFIAIVIVFPIISMLEYSWIKTIVETLKLSFVSDLEAEQNLINISAKSKLVGSFQKLMGTVSVIQIMNSKDYPIKSKLNLCYSSALSVFNLVASVVTILQYTTTSSIGFPHIF